MARNELDTAELKATILAQEREIQEQVPLIPHSHSCSPLPAALLPPPCLICARTHARIHQVLLLKELQEQLRKQQEEAQQEREAAQRAQHVHVTNLQLELQSLRQELATNSQDCYKLEQHWAQRDKTNAQMMAYMEQELKEVQGKYLDARQELRRAASCKVLSCSCACMQARTRADACAHLEQRSCAVGGLLCVVCLLCMYRNLTRGSLRRCQACTCLVSNVLVRNCMHAHVWIICMNTWVRVHRDTHTSLLRSLLLLILSNRRSCSNGACQKRAQA